MSQNSFFNIGSMLHFFVSSSNATANSAQILTAALQLRGIVYFINSSSTSNINLSHLMFLCKINCITRNYWIIYKESEKGLKFLIQLQVDINKKITNNNIPCDRTV